MNDGYASRSELLYGGYLPGQHEWHENISPGVGDRIVLRASDDDRWPKPYLVGVVKESSSGRLYIKDGGGTPRAVDHPGRTWAYYTEPGTSTEPMISNEPTTSTESPVGWKTRPFRSRDCYTYVEVELAAGTGHVWDYGRILNNGGYYVSGEVTKQRWDGPGRINCCIVRWRPITKQQGEERARALAQPASVSDSVSTTAQGEGLTMKFAANVVAVKGGFLGQVLYYPDVHGRPNEVVWQSAEPVTDARLPKPTTEELAKVTFQEDRQAALRQLAQADAQDQLAVVARKLFE